MNTVVAYIDGSAKPNNGWWGGGVHGYIYNNSKIGEKSGDKPNKYYITTTGYLEMSEVNKYPDYKTVVPSHYINGKYGYSDNGTNNMGELVGFIETARELLKLDMVFTNMIFKTDSQYLIHVVNGVKNDTARTWDNSGKINLNYWHMVEEVLVALKDRNIEYELVKVLGHSTSIGNHMADRMALLGRLSSSRRKPGIVFIVTPNKKYWTSDIERHPFLQYKQLFFMNNNRKLHDGGVYAIMNYKKDVEPGKKSHEATFGLVLLNNKQMYIEDVVNAYQTMLGDTSIVSTVNLSELYSQYVSNYYSLFGTDVFTTDNKRNILSFLEEIDIVQDIRPSGVATLAFNRIMEMQKIVTAYSQQQTNNPLYQFLNITDIFYGVEKGKKVTLIPNGTNEVKLNIKDIFGHDFPLTILLGKDTMERNIFKRMEKEDIKITLIFEKISDMCVSYYIVVDLYSRNDISVWCNINTNMVFVKEKNK